MRLDYTHHAGHLFDTNNEPLHSLGRQLEHGRMLTIQGKGVPCACSTSWRTRIEASPLTVFPHFGGFSRHYGLGVLCLLKWLARLMATRADFRDADKGGTTVVEELLQTHAPPFVEDAILKSGKKPVENEDGFQTVSDMRHCRDCIFFLRGESLTQRRTLVLVLALEH